MHGILSNLLYLSWSLSSLWVFHIHEPVRLDVHTGVAKDVPTCSVMWRCILGWVVSNVLEAHTPLNDRTHSFSNIIVTFQKTCIFIISFLDLVLIHSESVSISSYFIFDLFTPRNLMICSVAEDDNQCEHTFTVDHYCLKRFCCHLWVILW
jgi:hypothetical protein